MPQTYKWELKTYSNTTYTLSEVQYEAYLQAVSQKLDFISFKDFGIAIKNISEAKRKMIKDNHFQLPAENKNPGGLADIRASLRDRGLKV